MPSHFRKSNIHSDTTKMQQKGPLYFINDYWQFMNYSTSNFNPYEVCFHDEPEILLTEFSLESHSWKEHPGNLLFQRTITRQERNINTNENNQQAEVSITERWINMIRLLYAITGSDKTVSGLSRVFANDKPRIPDKTASTVPHSSWMDVVRKCWPRHSRNPAWN